MIAMRRCTSAIVMEAAPRGTGRSRCAAAGPGSTASSSARRYRIAKGLEGGETKANAPYRGGLRSGALALLARSRLAPLELGLGPRLLFRGLTLRLRPRLAARCGYLSPRLGARWRRLSAPPLFRDRAALRLRRPRGLLGPLRSLRPIGTITLVRALGILVMLGPLRTVPT